MTEARKKYFTDLHNILRDQNFQQKNLKVTLNEIQIVFSFKEGLLNDELKILAVFLCSTNLAPAINDEIIKCMVPRGPVSDDILDMFLVLILSRRKTHAHIKLSKLVLQWLLSVLDFGFAQLEPFQSYYHLFYPLLGYNELNAYACKMIYKLTKPIDVTEITIKRVMKYYLKKENSSRKVHIVTLLRHFASFKPDCINPELIQGDINVEQVFQSLPQSSSHLFAMIHGALLQKYDTLVPMIELKDSRMIQETRLNPSPVEKVNRLIPAITYSFPLDGELSILSFESITQMGQMVVRVAIPDQILSLLTNKVGHFKLMTCDETDQKRFADRLFDTLKQTFWEKKDTSSVNEQESFLDQIFNLCNLMQQGINLVTTFVGGFLLTWSGLEFRSQILHLIEWTVVDTYSELFLILKNLHMLFVTSDIVMKCQLIEALTNLVGNMDKVFYRVSNNITLPFMKSQIPTWTNDPLPMIKKTINFIDNLIQIGLCTEPDSSLFLDSAVSFYENVSVFQEVSNLPLLTVAPKGVVYRCFFNKNIMFLDRVAGLLLGYKNQYHRLEEVGLEMHFLCQKNFCDLYVKDILNTLWHGEGLTRGDDGIIFRLLSPDMLSIIKNLCPNNPNTLFELHNHMSLLTKRDMHPDESFAAQEKCYLLMEIYTEKIAKLVGMLT